MTALQIRGPARSSGYLLKIKDLINEGRKY